MGWRQARYKDFVIISVVLASTVRESFVSWKQSARDDAHAQHHAHFTKIWPVIEKIWNDFRIIKHSFDLWFWLKYCLQVTFWQACDSPLWFARHSIVVSDKWWTVIMPSESCSLHDRISFEYAIWSAACRSSTWGDKKVLPPDVLCGRVIHPPNLPRHLVEGPRVLAHHGSGS